MDKYKYHIIYRTTNLVNNKIYVGMHSTNNLEDNYLGSGWILKDAIKKYGRDKFSRLILYVYLTRAEARKMEALIVDKDFVERKDTYNLTTGGIGGEGQWGSDNHQFGKTAYNAKRVRATHKDGTVIEVESIKLLSPLIGIARENIRHLISKQIRGRRGWMVEHIVG